MTRTDPSRGLLIRRYRAGERISLTTPSGERVLIIVGAIRPNAKSVKIMIEASLEIKIGTEGACQ
jgi:hypothetical protein